jgi:hypothetical protein
MSEMGMSSLNRTVPSSKEAASVKKVEKTAAEVLSENVPEEIKNLAAYKSLVKEVEATETKRKKDRILKEVLELATAKAERPITTLAQFVVYFGSGKKKASGNGKRAPRMTEEQKQRINTLKAEGKSLREIREVCGVSEAQLNSFLYAKKKTK